MQGPIDFQEDLLGQVFGLIESSGEAIRQVVNPLGILANDGFPGAMVAGQAPSHQIRVGVLQPVFAPSLPLLPYLIANQRGGAKKSFNFLLPF
jgi:hypothetical protein